MLLEFFDFHAATIESGGVNTAATVSVAATLIILRFIVTIINILLLPVKISHNE